MKQVSGCSQRDRIFSVRMVGLRCGVMTSRRSACALFYQTSLPNPANPLISFNFLWGYIRPGSGCFYRLFFCLICGDPSDLGRFELWLGCRVAPGPPSYGQYGGERDDKNRQCNDPLRPGDFSLNDAEALRAGVPDADHQWTADAQCHCVPEQETLQAHARAQPPSRRPVHAHLRCIWQRTPTCHPVI